MNTKQIAEKLVEYCNTDNEEKTYSELYSPEIISVESSDSEFPKCKGMDEIQEKGKWWKENFEVHSLKASRPNVADDFFSVTFTMDTTHKPSGNRSTMTELAVYKVEEGKIVYEEFFY